MRRGFGLGLAALACLLAGCGLLPWGDARSRPAPLAQFKPSVELRTAWRASVGRSEAFALAPALAESKVFVASFEGQVLALDSASGAQLWRAQAGQKLSGGVGAGENLVLVGTPKGELLAFDATGKALWRAQLGGEVLAPPAVSDGLVLVRTADGRIFALGATDGKRRWIYQRTNPALTLRSHAGLIAERGAVFAGFPGGMLVALDLETGRVGWEVSIAQPRGATELERIADVSSLPVIDGEQVCAVAYQGRVACVDARSGRLNWSREMSSSAGLAVDGRNVYIAHESGAVLALDKASGASVWKQDRLANRRLGTPAVSGRYVLVGDGFGYVHVLSTVDGSFAGRAPTDGGALAAPPVLAGDAVLFQTRKGGVYALSVN